MVAKWVILMVLVMGSVQVHTLMLFGTSSLTTYIVCDPVRADNSEHSDCDAQWVL